MDPIRMEVIIAADSVEHAKRTLKYLAYRLAKADASSMNFSGGTLKDNFAASYEVITCQKKRSETQ